MITPGSNDIYIGSPLTSGSISVTTSGSSFSYAGVRWKFCPDCGKKLESAWKHCAECGKLIGASAQPFTSWYPTTAPGTHFMPTGRQACAFDGLPPGAYSLSCSCPKCSPQC